MKLREFMTGELVELVKASIGSTVKVEYVVQDYRGYVYDVYNARYFRDSVETDIPYQLETLEFHKKFYHLLDTDFLKVVNNYDNTMVVISKMNYDLNTFAKGLGYIIARVQRRLLKLQLVDHKDKTKVLKTFEQVDTPVATQLMMEELEKDTEYGSWIFVNHKVDDETKTMTIECIQPE